jgi:hypothetical protein
MRKFKARTTAGTTLEVDCDTLVPFLNAVKNGDGHKWMSNGSAYQAAIALDLVLTYDGVTRLRPQAEDFLATVAVYPFEPEPAPPKQDCTECGGKGKKPLFMSFYECERCKGSCVEPESRNPCREIRLGEYALHDVEITINGMKMFNPPCGTGHMEMYGSLRPQLSNNSLFAYRPLGNEVVKAAEEFEQLAATARTLSENTTPRKMEFWHDHIAASNARIDRPSDLKPRPSPFVQVTISKDGQMVATTIGRDEQPWTAINSEDVARSFVGKRVEIDAPECKIHDEHSLHGETRTLTASENGLIFEREGAINWMGRGNVRLRLAAEPEMR